MAELVFEGFPEAEVVYVHAIVFVDVDDPVVVFVDVNEFVD